MNVYYFISYFPSSHIIFLNHFKVTETYFVLGVHTKHW